MPLIYAIAVGAVLSAILKYFAYRQAYLKAVLEQCEARPNSPRASNVIPHAQTMKRLISGALVVAVIGYGASMRLTPGLFWAVLLPFRLIHWVLYLGSVRGCAVVSNRLLLWQAVRATALSYATDAPILLLLVTSSQS